MGLDMHSDIKNLVVCRTNYLHGAESLRSHQLLTYSRIPEHFMEPKDSLLCLQEPLVPILSQINSVHTTPSYLSKMHFNIVTY
jgi:hypothetical protein